MHNIGIFYLWALAAWILWQGSLAENQSGYVCMIDDPNPKQCDNFCRTELLRLLKEDARVHGPENTCDAGNRAKLESVADKQAKLEGQLHGVEAKLKGHLQKVQGELEAKLDESLAVQKKLETQLQAVVNQLQAVSNQIDAAKVGVPASVTITIPSGFELIGTRYFRIVRENVNWETAKKRCRELGGYLASFRNEEEFNVINPKLDNYAYWLGINDHDNEGHFVSVASHKPAPFLKWDEGNPSDTNHKWNCVYLFEGTMRDYFCSKIYSFICQADNET